MTPINPLIAEGHEDRIQRVEQSLTQVSTQVAEHGIKVGFMSQQIADTKKELTDKMDDLASDLTKKLDATCARIDKVTDKVEAQDERLDELELTEQTRQKRWGVVKKAALFVLTGVGGVLVAKLGEWLVSRG